MIFLAARLTHLFLLKGDVTPTCNFCQTPLSIKHVVLELSALNASRQCFYSENSLMDVFKNLLLFFFFYRMLCCLYLCEFI